jgi:acyl-coenzyme A synthetase/AMP-(fatty) acid ligase
MSPKLSAEAVAQLMQRTGSHRIITQTAFAPIVKAVQSQLAAENHTVEAEDLIPIERAFPALKSDSTDSDLTTGPYPSAPSEPAMDDIVIYIHSSGSTGFPKPVKLTRRIQLQWATSSMCIRI